MDTTILNDFFPVLELLPIQGAVQVRAKSGVRALLSLHDAVQITEILRKGVTAQQLVSRENPAKTSLETQHPSFMVRALEPADVSEALKYSSKRKASVDDE